jgi:hypothetical protein
MYVPVGRGGTVVFGFLGKEAVVFFLLLLGVFFCAGGADSIWGLFSGLGF